MEVKTLAVGLCNYFRRYISKTGVENNSIRGVHFSTKEYKLLATTHIAHGSAGKAGRPRVDLFWHQLC